MLLLRSVVTRHVRAPASVSSLPAHQDAESPQAHRRASEPNGPPVPADDVIADVVLSLAPAVVPSTRKPIRHVPPAPSEPPL